MFPVHLNGLFAHFGIPHASGVGLVAREREEIHGGALYVRLVQVPVTSTCHKYLSQVPVTSTCHREIVTYQSSVQRQFKPTDATEQTDKFHGVRLDFGRRGGGGSSSSSTGRGAAVVFAVVVVVVFPDCIPFMHFFLFSHQSNHTVDIAIVYGVQRIVCCPMDLNAVMKVGIDCCFEPSLGCPLFWVVHFNRLTHWINSFCTHW